MKKIFSMMLVLLMAATGMYAVEQAVSSVNHPDHVGKGKFSVAKNKLVYLTRSNLVYNPFTDRMSFHENPWDRSEYTIPYMTKEKLQDSIRNYNGNIDLFYFGATGYSDSPMPYDIFADGGDCAYGLREGHHFHDGSTFAYNSGGSIVQRSTSDFDWPYQYSVANDGVGAYRSLSAEEWSYLLFQRTDWSKKLAMAKVNDVPGMIILPDFWYTPLGLTLWTYDDTDYDHPYVHDGYHYACNQFDISEWQILENAGAVFLPAGHLGKVGHYMPDYKTEHYGLVNEDSWWLGDQGYYWTGSAGDNIETRTAKGFNFAGEYEDYSGVEMSNDAYRAYGHTVRLASTQNVSATDATPINKGTVYLELDESSGKATWNGITFTEPGTFYYIEPEADGHHDWYYTITVYAYVPTYKVRIEYELKDHANPTKWPSERLANYITAPYFTKPYVNRDNISLGGRVTFDLAFQSDEFELTRVRATDGTDHEGRYTYDKMEKIIKSDLTITIEFRPKGTYPVAKTSSARYGTASVSYTNTAEPNIAMDEWPELYNQDWSVTYSSTTTDKGQFYGWLPTEYVQSFDGNEPAAWAYFQAYLQEMEEDGRTDNIEYQIAQKFKQPSFTITWDELEAFRAFTNLKMFAYQNKPGMGVENVQPATVGSHKIMRDGQLFILRNGKTYNALGAELR